MILSPQTLSTLTDLINEKTMYRSGPELVKFFNRLGFNDVYQSGFPSRKTYTADRLERINGTPELDKCIKEVFNPINFIGRYNELDVFIDTLNQYLAYDGWNVYREGTTISFKKSNGVDIEEEKRKESAQYSAKGVTEEEFLNYEFREIDLDSISLIPTLSPYIEKRIEEIKICLKNDAPLAAIMLIGSSLEGVLLNVATMNPALMNKSTSAPKDRDSGKVKKFADWNLNSLIDVACEAGIIKDDVKKFSHVVRDFRNYIHPYEQMSHQFSPTNHTAKICFQVLKAALFQIGQFQNRK